MATLEFRTKTKRKNKLFYGILVLLLLAAACLLFYFYPFASSEKVQYISNKNSILVNGKIQGTAVQDGNQLYVPIKIVQKNIDQSLFIENNAVILTTNQNVIRMPLNKEGYTANQVSKKTDFPIVKSINNDIYIDLKTLTKIYPIQFHITKENKVIWIEKNNEAYEKGKITVKDTRKAFLRLRTKPDLHSSYVEEIKKGENIRIEKAIGEYYFVRTLEGIGGYIKKEYVTKNEKVQISTVTKDESTTSLKYNAPIHLTWEAVYTKTPNPDQLPKMPGVNIVSPTWFKLKNNQGDVTNLASDSYMKWARKNGFQVWALFSNSFDPTLTKEALTHYETRTKIINQLLTYVKTYKLDGLNIDIENVSPEDGPLVTQFVRELSVYLHNEGKYVSMDITFIAKGSWSEFYERDKLATVVDYLIVMAYDEHWASSPTAGSVASLPWVKNNLEQLLKEVPNEKLILGLPFFTRLWSEEMKDGQMSVSSKALSMDQANAWMKERNLKAQEDPETGQNYIEYKDAKTNIVYKMWLEDSLSLKKRAQLAAQYDLAGVASWARYFADDSAWLALQSSLSAFK
ncbi:MULTISPECIES: glycosyl hydrolase family 18 protein [Heyndrickxia]|jgi:spore germination protein YaaH|uniref:glycosyl hydrolase family 18 protein n=1 Tax=Heyndrickxia TaxID=2837504 RepID=UPI0024310193|nr:glycosyl hydrolase family 18 protein [Heyndrickxia oleronia]MCI1590755.1 glycosyl hydrolase family 18 protein [Heyndrickxia oleronia]MCI1612056.1 glycosyl hydrolase family 18 protein [Heyndrickxia oleronia]MCI1759765.1 glycosyl hydrolase family 18 protein [Heyndrickxia oleronia]